MSKQILEELFDLSGKVAVVTGGGGILCGEMSRALGRMGVKVVVLDIGLEAAEAVAEEIQEAGGEAMAVKCDVLDKDQIREAADKVVEAYGRVDILINGAGGNRSEATTSEEVPFFDLPEDAVRWVFNLNFLGTFLCCQVFGRLMAEQGEGVILNTASMTALRPLTKVPAYGAAKAAVTNFTEWLAVHMAQEYSADIRVNAVAPGFFLTTQNRYLLIDEETGDLTPRGQTIIDHTPMERFGEPEDLIGTMAYLLSPGASLVSGIVVPVDGAFSAFSGV